MTIDSTMVPAGGTRKGDKVYDARGRLIEIYEGEWRVVVDGGRSGWWRFNEHYDRDGYCDNPARGY